MSITQGPRVTFRGHLSKKKMFEVTVMLKHDSWCYLHHCWPRRSLTLQNIQTCESCIIISWIENVAPLKPEKLLGFSWNLMSPFPTQKYSICPVSYYCQGFLVNLLFISTVQFITSWKISLSLHARLLPTSVTQFYAFIPYIMWN